MTERSVFFATPGRGGWVSIEYHALTLEASHILVMRGIKPLFGALGGNIYVDHARNRLATDFLSRPEKPTDLFWIDDDVGTPTAQKIIEFLERPEDIVCGAPPLKQDAGADGKQQFPIALRLDEAGNLVQQNGVLSIVMGPTGFMRIKRHVLERMAETTETYIADNPDGNPPTQLYYFFRAGPRDGRWHTEDTAFIKDWLAMGGSAWVDPDIMFTHRGEKVWTGRYADLFKREAVVDGSAEP